MTKFLIGGGGPALKPLHEKSIDLCAFPEKA